MTPTLTMVASNRLRERRSSVMSARPAGHGRSVPWTREFPHRNPALFVLVLVLVLVLELGFSRPAARRACRGAARTQTRRPPGGRNSSTEHEHEHEHESEDARRLTWARGMGGFGCSTCAPDVSPI